MKPGNNVTAFEVLAHWFETESKRESIAHDLEAVRYRFNHFRRGLTKSLPNDMNWQIAEIEPKDVERIFLLTSENLEDDGIADDTYQLTKAIDTVESSLKSGVESTFLGELQAMLSDHDKGIDLGGRLILVSDSIDGPFTVIEGNHRALVYATGNELIGREVYIGISSSVRKYSWAYATYRHENYLLPRAALEARLVNDGDDPETLLELAVCHWRAGQTSQALDVLEDAINRHSENTELLAQFAEILHASGDDRAGSAYESYLKINEENAYIWRMYALVLRSAGESKNAIDAIKRSLDLEHDTGSWNMLVTMLHSENRIEEAASEGNKLLNYKCSMALKRTDSALSCQAKAVPVFNYKTPRRNAIAFSLWGDNPVYTKGAVENVLLAKHLYYGWRCLFYCDDSVPTATLEELRDHGADVKMVTDREILEHKMFWRFFVSDSSDYDYFLVRDADARVNCQEVNAVDEWLSSGKPFHIMRDHIYHLEPIMGGMWGGVSGVLPNLRKILLDNKRQYAKLRWTDQFFLQNIVWPLIHERAVIHDSWYQVPGSQPFPGNYRLPGSVHVGGGQK